MPLHLLLAALLGLAPDSVRVTVTPTAVLVPRRDGQHLDCDLLVENRTGDTLTLRELSLVVRDEAGRVTDRRSVRGPALETVGPDRVVAPGARGLVFNPHHTLPSELQLARLEFRLAYTRSGGSVRAGADSAIGTVIVVPRGERPRTTPMMPLAGRILVDEGPGIYSHHRRLPLLSPVLRPLGVTRNFMRYALDLLPVDSAGRRYRGDGAHREDWLGWDQPVRAPAAGRVVATWNDQPDNTEIGRENLWDPSTMQRDPLSLYGNYVLVDHGGGEYSMLGHLRRGSVVVQGGDRVAAGAVVGHVGSSGSSLYPHLHYELRTAPTLDADGLPLYFSDVRPVSLPRVTGAWFAGNGDVLVPR